MSDVFNNPSNDYVNPGLAPCAGTSDDYNFKFIKDGAGVINGSEIVQFIDLTGINIPITAWTSEKKTLQSGEVAYVPGLVKGLQQRVQVFDLYDYNESGQEYFFSIDLSVNFYDNFRYYNINVAATADYDTGITIENALNTALSNSLVKMSVSYDAASFTFTGDTAGYDFDITNVQIGIIDSSMNSASPFTYPWMIANDVSLNEDVSAEILPAQYPNGAMLGYLMTAKFPATAYPSQKWVYTNHVSSPFNVYEPVSVINVVDISVYKTVVFDSTITFTDFPLTIDTTLFVPSILSESSTNEIIDANFVAYSNISDSSISNSVIIDSSISNGILYDSSLSGFIDSSVYTFLSDISINNISGIKIDIADSPILDSLIKDSFIGGTSVVVDSSIQNVWVNGMVFGTEGQIINNEESDRVTLNNVEVVDTSLYNVIISDSSIYGSDVYDSSLYRCTLYNTNIDDNSYLEDERTIYVNGTLDSSVSWTENSTTYYEKLSKKIDVGRSVEGTTTILSAGEYLDYINTNNLWQKVGYFDSQISATDLNDSKNLVGGFYIFNPQSFTVEVEYLLIN